MSFDRKIYFSDDYNKKPAQQPANQKWKTDPDLHSCERVDDGIQSKKLMDYYDKYVPEFLDSDPIRDWESIDRAIALFQFFLNQISTEKTFVNNWLILDCGTKDGQFPEWLSKQGYVDAKGIEISGDYVKWAQDHNRPVEYCDVCDMPPKWDNKFDVVFSHHLLGLVPDYFVGLQEMFRVTKPNGYMVTLNDCPGNPRKHYSYIDSPEIFETFTGLTGAKEIYSGYWNTDMPKEWVYIIQKNAK